MFKSYDQDLPGEGTINESFEEIYDTVNPYIMNLKLAPVNKWDVLHRVLEAESSNYKIEYYNVLIPFSAAPEMDEDSAYLRIVLKAVTMKVLHS